MRVLTSLVLLLPSSAFADSPVRLVADINDGAGGSSPSGFVGFDGDVLFEAYGVNGSELYRFDGVSVTEEVDIASGSTSSTPLDLVVWDGALWMSASNGTSRELYSWNGTTATRHSVGLVDGTAPSDLVVFRDDLFFIADIDGRTNHIVRYDGSAFDALIGASGSTGDHRALDLVQVPSSFSLDSPYDGFDFLFFSSAGIGTTSHYSDPSLTCQQNALGELHHPSGSTWDDDDLEVNWTYTQRPHWSGSACLYIPFLAGVAIEDADGVPTVVYGADAGDWDNYLDAHGFGADLGSELYTTRFGGIQLVADIHPSASSEPRYLTALGGEVYFSADDGTTGRELWVSDGTVGGGATRVADIHPTSSSYPEDLTAFDGKLYFSAVDGSHGRELWVHDPSGGTTTLVADIEAGAGGSFPDALGVAGGKLHFSATLTGVGAELWVLEANASPVADAGPNQTGAVYDTMILDGTGSWDDTTASEDLVYEWTLVTVPTGSSASLSDADTDAPSIVLDMRGDYVVELVVSDLQRDESTAATVTLSALNSPPNADAGPTQTGVVGFAVSLDGSGSDDPDGDVISYAWELTSTPPGSTAALSSAATVSPGLSPDAAGLYEVELVVDDGYDSSEPDTTSVAVVSVKDYASSQVAEALDALAAMDRSDLSSPGNGRALQAQLLGVLAKISDGNFAAAISKLYQLRARVDGCEDDGSPDTTGPGHDRDWVLSCSDQADIVDAIDDALAVLE